MTAIVQHAYGPPENLLLREVRTPVARENEVLIRVRAAAVHVGDCFGVRGKPLLMRAATGIFRPTCKTPGYDLAGTVVAVGNGVEQFKPGDDVFGASRGTCAQYVCALADTLALKPAKLLFDEAACIATSGLAALHGLRDAGKVTAGQRVLINGASGGVGTFAVQIAKSYGAEVTAVCSTKNIDMVRAIGADEVIDYTREDFVDGGPRFDLMLDNVENRSLADCRRALKPQGTLLLNSGTGATGLRLLVRLVKPLVLSPFSQQNLRRFLSTPNHDDLVQLKELIESGVVKPVVGKTYPLSCTAEAIRYIESGHAAGKVVITIDPTTREAIEPDDD